MISDDKIITHLIDSTDSGACKNFVPNISFDIILDDGLHTSDGQIKTFRNFYSRVKDGGLYIIEDVGGGGDSLNVWVEHKEEILNSISDHEYFYGGNILIIRKSNSQKGEVTFHDLIKNEIIQPQSSNLITDVFA